MSRHASPTAQLLRNSRLFSLPQALPRPILEQHVRDGKLRSSDSATTPYPLRQAIVTPASSAHRGDWGLKRSLPKKAANRASEPFHTVFANDTYEGITDYHSASPHVKTLQRFQELNVALTRQDQKVGLMDSNISAMEPSLDFTDESTGGDRRWKYGGGHVRSMAPAEFDKYLDDTVAQRKDEFMAHLRQRAHVMLMAEKRDSRAKSLRDEGPTADDPLLVAMTSFTHWLESMRDARGPVLSAYMTPATANEPLSYAANIRHLLRNHWWTEALETDESPEALQLKDLTHVTTAPPTPSPVHLAKPMLEQSSPQAWLTVLSHISQLETDFLHAWQTNSWDPDGSLFHSRLQAWRKDTTLLSPINTIARRFLDLPPLPNSTSRAGMPENLRGSQPEVNLSTHPSAGLSYLRTNKVLPNHPILGPQKSTPPIKARFIGKAGFESKSLYGVSGFVASSETGNRELDLTTPGGAKGERRIKNVWVNGEGRVQVVLENSGDREALGVREGRLEPENRREMEARDRSAGLIGTLRKGAQRSRMVSRARPVENEAVSRLRDVGRRIERQPQP